MLPSKKKSTWSCLRSVALGTGDSGRDSTDYDRQGGNGTSTSMRHTCPLDSPGANWIGACIPGGQPLVSPFQPQASITSSLHLTPRRSPISLPPKSRINSPSPTAATQNGYWAAAFTGGGTGSSSPSTRKGSQAKSWPNSRWNTAMQSKHPAQVTT